MNTVLSILNFVAQPEIVFKLALCVREENQTGSKQENIITRENTISDLRGKYNKYSKNLHRSRGKIYFLRDKVAEIKLNIKTRYILLAFPLIAFYTSV